MSDRKYFFCLLSVFYFNAKSRVWLPVWKFKDCNTRYNSSGTVENGTRDIYLFRLAETYLIAAEAAVKMGDNSITPNPYYFLIADRWIEYSTM